MRGTEAVLTAAAVTLAIGVMRVLVETLEAGVDAIGFVPELAGTG